MSFEKYSPLMLELGVAPEHLPRVKAYIDLLWSSNEELNLISRKMTYQELIENHLIDCLLPLKYFPKDLGQAADFGSGGGLPGVLYGILFPNTTYHLFEKSIKKQAFLKQCQKIAPNLQIHGEIPLELTDIEVVTARAFKPLDVILEMSRNYFNSGGRYFLLKARKEKIEEELVLARKKFTSLNSKIVILESPLLEVERHLVLIP